jgi:hypothetical protein
MSKCFIAKAHTHTHCSPLTHKANKEKLKQMTIHDANGIINVIARVGKQKTRAKNLMMQAFG